MAALASGVRRVGWRAGSMVTNRGAAVVPEAQRRFATLAAENHEVHSHKPMSADPRFGTGFYSDKTKGCYDVILAAAPLVLDSASAVQEAVATSDGWGPNDAFVVADYGTADGGTSMPMMYELCKWVRQTMGETPVQIFYEDQPLNMWHDLFMRLQGLLPGDGRSPNFMQEFDNVFAAAIGQSFYQQNVPSSTVHLGFSATAMHWLTRPPGQFSSVIHHTLCDSEAEKAPFAAQAAKDWELVLLQRAKELVPGGRLVLLNFCVDDQGQYLGTTDRVKNKMWSTKNRIWWDLCSEGIITREEAVGASFANYYRTVAEFQAPFEDPQSAVRQAGLKLVDIETRCTPCPYQQSWEATEASGVESSAEAALEYAKEFVLTTRTWSNSVYVDALDEARDSDNTRMGRNEVVDLLFARYAEEVAASPADHAMDYVHAFVVLEKERS